MKVLGIGNAIVDVICKIEDSFLTENNLTKSTMKLVDKTEFKKLLSNLKIEETMAGGSVANSMVGLSQLKNKVCKSSKLLGTFPLCFSINCFDSKYTLLALFLKRPILLINFSIFFLS